MKGRRRGASSESGDTPQPDLPPGAPPQGTLTLRGSADALRDQLAGGEKDKSEPKPPPNGHDDEKKKFVDALRNSKYIIRVKRLTPREFNGVKTNVEVWSAELPLAYQEIQDEIKKDCGGGKYRVAVIDPNSNSTICADVFEVDGEPLLPEGQETQEEIDRMLMRGGPKSAADLTEEGLDRRARVSAKMLEVEALEAQLEEARKRRDPGAKPQAQDNTRVDELERRLTESKHQAELEARDRRHAEEMRELKAMIAQNAKPQKDDSMTMLLEQMREDRKAAQQQFTAILTQMKDDKLNAVLEEVKSIRNRPNPQSGSLLEQAEAMLKLRKLFGWGEGDDDDDEEDDKEDDRPWWEKALDKLGGKFGDKLLEKFTSMEEKGEKVDREKFLAEMHLYADQVAAEAVAAKQRQLPAPPPPAGQLPPPPPPPKAVVAIPPVVTALPPPPPAAIPAAPAAPSAPTPELPQKLTLEQEIVIRVGGVLEILEREIELRPNEYHWNYEGCFLALPESILEKVCASPDPVAMLDAFAIQHISPEKISEMKAKVSGNPRIMAWVKAGHDELKDWYSEKLKDPTFDPFADEEEERVEE